MTMKYSQINWLEISKAIHVGAQEKFALSDFSQEIQFLFSHLSFFRQESQSPAEAYGRHVLYSSPDFEVMMASWLPHAECAPHDHGFSTGTVLILEGHFQEISYEFIGGRYLARPSTLREARKNQFIEVDGSTFHSMKSMEKTGVTLHFYTPAIHNMQVLDMKNKSTLIVSDNCGAWVPENPDKVKEQRPWNH